MAQTMWAEAWYGGPRPALSIIPQGHFIFYKDESLNFVNVLIARVLQAAGALRELLLRDQFL